MLVAGYVAIRFRNLTDPCLWFDEIFSVHAATQPWDSFLSFVALDLIHPPLFYILLKFWIGLGGESLYWLRLFPVVVSVIALFPFVEICRELKLSIRTRLLALFLFAVNGSLIKYAQEVRMYSLLLCVSLFSICLFARYFGKGKNLPILVVVNILLVYTHYFGWFVVLSEVAAIAIFQRVKLRRILAMPAIALVAFLPWIFAVWQASQNGSGLAQNIGWMARPGPKALVQLVLNLIEPFYYQASSAEPISIFRVSMPVLILFCVAVFLLIAAWDRQAERETLKLLSIFIIVPLAVVFGVSWLLPYSFWGARHLIIIFAPVSIVLAIIGGQISVWAIRAAVLTLIVLFTGLAFQLATERESPKYEWCAWNKAATEFAASRAASESIYAFEELSAYHLWFALRNTENAKVRLVKDTGVSEDPAYFLPRGFDAIDRIQLGDITETTFWIAFRSKDWDERHIPLALFRERGYRFDPPKLLFESTNSKAYIVRAERP